MSRLLFVLLFVLSLTSFLTPRVSGQNIDVTLPDTLIQGNNTVFLPMSIDDVTGLEIISFEFTITYDSTVIQFDEIRATDYLADGYLVIPNSTIPGRLSVAAAGTAPLAGRGILLALGVTFLKEGDSNLIFEDFDFGINNINIRTRNGRIRNISLANRENDEIVDTRFSLQGNYPNPFSEGTHIVLDLMEPAEVGIQVFDVLGRLVYSTEQDHLQIGMHHVYLDLDALPAGTYFYHVNLTGQSGHYILSDTMTFIR